MQMKMEINANTPLSVLLHVYPEAESVLNTYFKKVKFSSIVERVRTLEDIAKEENVELDTVIDSLKKKLAE
jgi:hypothetical protein